MTRAGEAGTKLALAIVEMIHLMYQKKTAIRFLSHLVSELEKELRLRLREK